MTVEALTGVLALPGPRRTPVAERTASAVGPMPWLTSTGRLDQVLTVWGRGHLAEVPVGLGFDVLLTPAIAEDTVRRMREAGRRVGPVILGPSRRGVHHRTQLRATLVRAPLAAPRAGGAGPLAPAHCVPPGDGGIRGWPVPPIHEETGALPCAEVTPGGALLEPFLAAIHAAEDEEADSGQ